MESNKRTTNIVIILLGVLLAIVIIVFFVLAGILLFGSNGSSETEPGATSLPPAGIATLPPLQPSATPPPLATLPAPAPEDPTGIVIAPDGVFVRTGPSTAYPAIGAAPLGTTGKIVGKSGDGSWWAFQLPNAPNQQGWAAAVFIQATNVENVPVIPAPPLPVPTATATTAATPAPIAYFTANPITIGQGACSTLAWKVQNVQAVWVYPLGEPYQNYPVTGEGTKQVCPNTTTTYEMRVQTLDGTVFLQQLTISVVTANPLANTAWAVASLFVNTTPIEGTTLTAVFGGDSNISVNGGCNSYNGTYQVTGSAITIGPFSGTQVACDPAVSGQEQSYIAALLSAAMYQISGNQLILFDAAGQEIVRFSRTG